MEGRGGRKRERGEEREKREVTRGNSSGCWCFPREVVQGEQSQERTDLAKDPEKGMVHTSGNGVPSYAWEPRPPCPRPAPGPSSLPVLGTGSICQQQPSTSQEVVYAGPPNRVRPHLASLMGTPSPHKQPIAHVTREGGKVLPPTTAALPTYGHSGTPESTDGHGHTSDTFMHLPLLDPSIPGFETWLLCLKS